MMYTVVLLISEPCVAHMVLGTNIYQFHITVSGLDTYDT